MAQLIIIGFFLTLLFLVFKNFLEIFNQEPTPRYIIISLILTVILAFGVLALMYYTLENYQAIIDYVFHE